jgi:hypothetical protein
MRGNCPQAGEWVTRYSSRGTAYERWEPLMPRIEDAQLECVVYLYGSKEEAEAGINIGGSGFLVYYPASQGRPGGFIYAVTNRHIIREKCSTVRLNTIDGKTDVFEYHPDQWTISKTDDLAVIALPGHISHTAYRFNTVKMTMLLTEEHVAIYNLGVGDDVALIGRFINIEGKQRNIPTARFGHVAQMPLEPIDSEDDGVPYKQESFLADIKSIGGYSGSPVFWDATVGRPKHVEQRAKLGRERGETPIFLLGVDWAHIRDWDPVCGVDKKPLSANYQIEINTGIAAIVPAWKLRDLLENPMLKRERQESEDAHFSSVAKPDGAFGAASSEKQADDANPNHLKDFTRLVDVAARKRPQGDQT